jgi:DNA-binding NarL/FixJ family response regulator
LRYLFITIKPDIYSVKIPVAIVEDNTEIRNAIEQIIELSDNYKLVCSCPTGEDALLTLPLFKPRVVLMDINLGSMTGIEIIKKLKPDYPEILYLMCTIYDDDEKIFEALKAGANGYILKKTAPTKLLEGIAEILEGGAPMSSQIARKVVMLFQNQNNLNPSDDGVVKENEYLQSLSKRELEILHLLSKGYTNKEIAQKVLITYETVRKHAFNIYEKLHVNSRVEAINVYLNR